MGKTGCLSRLFGSIYLDLHARVHRWVVDTAPFYALGPNLVYMKVAFVLAAASTVSVLAQGTNDCRRLHCYRNGTYLITNGSEIACQSEYPFTQACYDRHPDVPVCDESAGAS
jgi:hypothetical protein